MAQDRLPHIRRCCFRPALCVSYPGGYAPRGYLAGAVRAAVVYQEQLSGTAGPGVPPAGPLDDFRPMLSEPFFLIIERQAAAGTGRIPLAARLGYLPGDAV